MADLESPPSSRGARAAWLPAAALLTLFITTVRHIDSGTWWTHLATGRYIALHGIPRTDPGTGLAPPGSPWIAQSWLYDRLVYALWPAGPAVAILAHAALATLAFAALLPLARRHAGPTGIALGLLTAAWILAPVFEIGPVGPAMVFAALFLAVFHRPLPNRLRWPLLLALQVLWTNLHPSFLGGPILAAVAMIWPADDAAPRPSSATVAGLPAALLASTLVNPYGPALPFHVIASALAPGSAYLQEWISPFSGDFRSPIPRWTMTGAMFVGFAGLAVPPGRLPRHPLALAAAGALAALVLPMALPAKAPTQLPALALLGLPWFAFSFSAVGERLRGLPPVSASAAGRAGRTIATAAVAASLAAFVGGTVYRSLGSATSFGLGVVEELFPAAAAPLLARPEVPARVVNLPRDGGYLAWTCPDQPVFVDQRPGLYPTDRLKEFLAGLTGDPAAWQAFSERVQPEAILLNATWSGCDAALLHLLGSGQWRLAYFDGVTPLLILRRPDLDQALADPALQRQGLEALEAARRGYRQRIARPGRAPVSPRLVGAARVFLALGRLPEAAAAYDLLLTNAPSMKKGWRALGVAQLESGLVDEAVHALETSSKVWNDDPLTWWWLSRAYRLAGRADDGEAALERARRLRPDLDPSAAAGHDPTLRD